MKTKILTVVAAGLAVLFLGAAPNSNHSKKSQNAGSNTGAYFCGYHLNHGRMMNGTASDSTYQGPTGGWYGCGAMNRTVSDSTYGSMMKGAYGRGYGMMPMMMSMMGMMRGRMMYGVNDSGFVCPYADYTARPQRQKGGK